MVVIPTPLSKISDENTLIQFLNDCINDLIGIKTGASSPYATTISWTSEELNAARSFIQNLYRENASNLEFNLNEATSDLSETFQHYIKECYELRKSEIIQALIDENLSKNGLISDYDWKLKYIMGCSTLATYRKPVLQLDLNGHTPESTVNLELGVKEVDVLLNALKTM